MAVQNENGKKSIVEDLTNHCCQWALDGLCDRSWQRIRELWLGVLILFFYNKKGIY